MNFQKALITSIYLACMYNAACSQPTVVYYRFPDHVNEKVLEGADFLKSRGYEYFEINLSVRDPETYWIVMWPQSANPDSSNRYQQYSYYVLNKTNYVLFIDENNQYKLTIEWDDLFAFRGDVPLVYDETKKRFGQRPRRRFTRYDPPFSFSFNQTEILTVYTH